MSSNEIAVAREHEASFALPAEPRYSDGPIMLGYIPEPKEDQLSHLGEDKAAVEDDPDEFWRLQYDMYMELHREMVVRLAEVGLGFYAITYALTGTTIAERIGSICAAGIASLSFGAHLVDKYHRQGPGSRRPGIDDD